MAFYKAIQHGKENRRPWRGSKAFDPSCRNHKGCPWCAKGRRFFDRKARARVQYVEE